MGGFYWCLRVPEDAGCRSPPTGICGDLRGRPMFSSGRPMAEMMVMKGGASNVPRPPHTRMLSRYFLRRLSVMISPLVILCSMGNCDDKLNNCFLAVQARLCNYNYYINNCCQSCAGR